MKYYKQTRQLICQDRSSSDIDFFYKTDGKKWWYKTENYPGWALTLSFEVPIDTLQELTMDEVFAELL